MGSTFTGMLVLDDRLPVALATEYWVSATASVAPTFAPAEPWLVVRWWHRSMIHEGDRTSCRSVRCAPGEAWVRRKSRSCRQKLHAATRG